MSNQQDAASSGAQWFQSTSWSLVQAAGDTANPDSEEALAKLCKAYWPPIYAYCRRMGNDAECSEDLVQGFFAQFLDKRYVKTAQRERGKFRSFLLACFKHYVSNERSRANAKKRGGGQHPIRLDLADAESRREFEPVDRHTPERLFDERWALTLIHHALERLQAEMRQSPDPQRFEHLKHFLIPDAANVSYKQVASELNISEAAVKVAVHRLRRKYAAALREEVAQTLTDPSQIDEEIRHLLSVIGT